MASITSARMSGGLRSVLASGRTPSYQRTATLPLPLTLPTPSSISPGSGCLIRLGQAEERPVSWGKAYLRTITIAPCHTRTSFSFDIQRELPGNMLAEIGYAGNLTRRLPISGTPGNNLNVLPASALGRRTASGAIDTAWYTERVPNPMQGLIPDNANLNGATIPRQQLLVPFPQFSQLSLQNLPIGRQSYNGLQTKLTKRFSQGFTFVASYAFSKTLEQPRCSILRISFSTTSMPRRSRSGRLRRRMFRIGSPSPEYCEVPVGKGKRFGSALPKVADYAFGGWQLNWNLALQSGWAIDYPNAKQVQSGDASPTDEQRSQGYLINTSLWTNPATGRLVGSQEQFTLRDFPTPLQQRACTGLQESRRFDFEDFSGH